MIQNTVFFSKRPIIEKQTVLIVHPFENFNYVFILVFH